MDKPSRHQNGRTNRLSDVPDEERGGSMPLESSFQLPKRASQRAASLPQNAAHARKDSKDAVLSACAKPYAAQHSALLVSVAGCSYCISSVGMVLVNKLALTAFPGSSATGLLFLQCGICAVLAGSSQLMGFVKGQRLNWRVVQSWFPSNVLFVAMLWTSVVALKYLSVPMAAVLKSLANVLTILGDWLLFRRTYSAGIWWSLLLITLSSIAGGAFDLQFSAVGYTWQIINCFLTAGYSLYIKKAIEDAAQHTPDQQPLTESTMVLLNNALCLPVLVLLLGATGEWESIMVQAGKLASQDFAMVAIISGFFAFALSYSSLWFLSVSTPTSYSLVGNLNKVPAAVGSYFMFHDRTLTSPPSAASLLLGILGGVVFVGAKTRMANQTAQASPNGLAAEDPAAGALLLPYPPQLPLTPLPRRKPGGSGRMSHHLSTDKENIPPASLTDPTLQERGIILTKGTITAVVAGRLHGVPAFTGQQSTAIRPVLARPGAGSGGAVSDSQVLDGNINKRQQQFKGASAVIGDPGNIQQSLAYRAGQPCDDLTGNVMAHLSLTGNLRQAPLLSSTPAAATAERRRRTTAPLATQDGGVEPNSAIAATGNMQDGLHAWLQLPRQEVMGRHMRDVFDEDGTWLPSQHEYLNDVPGHVEGQPATPSGITALPDLLWDQANAGDSPWANAGDSPWANAGDSPWANAGDSPWASAGDSPWASATPIHLRDRELQMPVEVPEPASVQRCQAHMLVGEDAAPQRWSSQRSLTDLPQGVPLSNAVGLHIGRSVSERVACDSSAVASDPLIDSTVLRLQPASFSQRVWGAISQARWRWRVSPSVSQAPSQPMSPRGDVRMDSPRALHQRPHEE